MEDTVEIEEKRKGFMERFFWLKMHVLFAALTLSAAASAQAAPWVDDSFPDHTLQIVSQKEGANQAENMAPAVVTATAPSTVTIPAGTRVLMVLRSPLHTTSGTAGSGIYLETLFPLIQGHRVVVPAHTQVQGVVEGNRRPGHLDRTSEFRFRFTTLIFPNNYVATIEAGLQSIPGARNIRTVDKAGTLKPVDQTEKVITPMAAGAVGGAIIGSVEHYGIGLLPGAGLGAGLGLGSMLLKRGDEISLVEGTNVEMILQAPLSLEQSQVAANQSYAATPSSIPAIQAPDGDRKREKERYLRERRLPGLAGLLFAPDE